MWGQAAAHSGYPQGNHQEESDWGIEFIILWSSSAGQFQNCFCNIIVRQGCHHEISVPWPTGFRAGRILEPQLVSYAVFKPEISSNTSELGVWMEWNHNFAALLPPSPPVSWEDGPWGEMNRINLPSSRSAPLSWPLCYILWQILSLFFDDKTRI